MNESKNIYDAVVIGAGPAGLMACISAARRGKNILLLEKNDIPGEKLLISGKGRCNITNAVEDIAEFIREFSPSGKFLRNCFHIFSNKDLMRFFDGNGVSLKVERGKRVFPESGNSRDVLNLFLRHMKKYRVRCVFNADVSEVKKNTVLFEIVTKRSQRFLSEKVLISTGGLSYPDTGSSGFGLAVAKKFGHTIIDTKPALVGLNIKTFPTKEWRGISLRNVTCTLICDGKAIVEKFGEMLFTHYGVSGPVILDLSAEAYDQIENRKSVHISIDFKPALTYDKLEKRIIREFQNNRNKSMGSILKILLPKRMAPAFSSICGITPYKKANQVTKKERISLVKALKGLCFSVSSTRPIEEAIVTRGGVSTEEINPKTMESKLVKGLFFAGEIIDVDAKTGGYNMQAAFSTGYVAGENI